MTTISENPYAAPQPDSTVLVAGTSDLDYRAVLRRWEMLRVLYNLIVGAAGVFAVVASISKYGVFETVMHILFYGLAANVCFTFGPLLELYLNWLHDIAARKSWPRLPQAFVRSLAPTILLFGLGTLISAFLTFFGGLVLLWGM